MLSYVETGQTEETIIFIANVQWNVKAFEMKMTHILSNVELLYHHNSDKLSKYFARESHILKLECSGLPEIIHPEPAQPDPNRFGSGLSNI